MVRLVCLGFIGLLASTASAQQTSPVDRRHEPKQYFQVILHNPESVDTLVMRCRTPAENDVELRELNCDFEHIIVTKTETSEQELVNYERQLGAEMEKPGSLKKALENCASNRKYRAYQRSATLNKYKLATVDNEAKSDEVLCACKTKECVVSAGLAAKKSEGSTCNISGKKFEAKFKRQDQTRWVSVDGPDGICGIVLTIVIQYNRAKDAWTYTQKRVLTDTGSKFCASEFESTLKAYSDDVYFTAARMNCDNIGSILP